MKKTFMPDDKQISEINEEYSWIEKYGTIQEACGEGDGWPPEGWQWHDWYPSEYSPPWEASSENVWWQKWDYGDKYYDMYGEWEVVSWDVTRQLVDSWVYNCVPSDPYPWSKKWYHLTYRMTSWAWITWIAPTDPGIMEFLPGPGILSAFGLRDEFSIFNFLEVEKNA